MAWKIILFLALIALSESKPPTSEQRVKIFLHNGPQEPDSEEVYVSSYPSYEFTYEVWDPHTHDFKGHHEQRKGDEVKGYYWLIQPDGLKRTVKYRVDKHSGFKAHVEYNKHLQNENGRDDANEESNADSENDNNARDVNSEEADNNIENENEDERENHSGGEERESIEDTNKEEEVESEQEDNSKGSNVQESEQIFHVINGGRYAIGRRKPINNNGREKQALLESWNRVRNNLRQEENGNDGLNDGERYQGRSIEPRNRDRNNIIEENPNSGVGVWQPNKLNIWGQHRSYENTGSDNLLDIASNSVQNDNMKVTEEENRETRERSRQGVEQDHRRESRSRQGRRGESRFEGNRDGEGRRGQRRGRGLNKFKAGNRNEERGERRNQRNVNYETQGKKEEEQKQRNSSEENNTDSSNRIENETNEIIKSEYHVIIHHPSKH